MTAPSDRDEQAPRKPLCAPERPETPVAGTERRPGVVSEPHRGSQRLHGRAVLTVTVDAPDARHAIRWAGYLRNHVEAEYGDQMRLQTAIELDDPDCGCHTAGSEPPRCEHCDCPNPVACPDAPDPDQPAPQGRDVYRAAFQRLLPEGSWHLAGRLADTAAGLADPWTRAVEQRNTRLRAEVSQLSADVDHRDQTIRHLENGLRHERQALADARDYLNQVPAHHINSQVRADLNRRLDARP